MIGKRTMLCSGPTCTPTAAAPCVFRLSQHVQWVPWLPCVGGLTVLAIPVHSQAPLGAAVVVEEGRRRPLAAAPQDRLSPHASHGAAIYPHVARGAMRAPPPPKLPLSEVLFSPSVGLCRARAAATERPTASGDCVSGFQAFCSPTSNEAATVGQQPARVLNVPLAKDLWAAEPRKSKSELPVH